MQFVTLRIRAIALLGLALVLLASCSREQQGMVSTANPHASRAAWSMLQKGGSAADASIAAQLVLTLVEPQSSGIGGGLFALHWDPLKGEVNALDGREKAPAAATGDLFIKADGTPMSWPFAAAGGRAVGVPGVVAALWKLHEAHGKLPWKTLFEPAIALAQGGFPVSRRLHEAIVQSPRLVEDRHARKLYFLPNEGVAPVPIGYKLKNPAYAATLRKIAGDGPDSFYRGEIAEAIVAAVRGHKTNPGLMSLGDLERYDAVDRKPVCATYKAYRVCGMPPPTSGGLTSLMVLGMLEPYALERYRSSSPVARHLFTQASRLAYADRATYMADADFVDVPVDGLLDRAYLASRARLIDAGNDSAAASAGVPPGVSPELRKAADAGLKEYGTSHLAVVDARGNAVSMTMSVEQRFGAQIMAAGFVLNNQLTDFSFVAERNGLPVANRVEGGKRPRSSMSPTLIFDKDGKLFAAVGSPGGSRIILYVTQTIIGLIDWKLSMQDAIDLGHVINRNGATEVESASSVASMVPVLKGMGHKIKLRPLTSGLHGVRVLDGEFDGGADRRREGLVLPQN